MTNEHSIDFILDQLLNTVNTKEVNNLEFFLIFSTHNKEYYWSKHFYSIYNL